MNRNNSVSDSKVGSGREEVDTQAERRRVSFSLFGVREASRNRERKDSLFQTVCFAHGPKDNY